MQTPLRIVYFGTPDFSADFLTRLLDAALPVVVVAVVTQQDQKAGRKQILTPSAVKGVASTRGIDVYHRWNDLKTHAVAFDLALVFAYGTILPQEALDLAPLGYWNVHPSLLPAYRGPNPIGAPLLEGRSKTGCSIMYMDNQMDHGPVICQEELDIEPAEQREQLTGRMVALGFDLFSRSITTLVKDGVVAITKQDHKKATYTTLLRKADGFVPFARLRGALLEDGVVSAELFNLWRAQYPWPGVWTTLPMEAGPLRLKLTQMTLDAKTPVVTHVQLAGKNEVTLKQFRQAYAGLLSNSEERSDEKGE